MAGKRQRTGARQGKSSQVREGACLPHGSDPCAHGSRSDARCVEQHSKKVRGKSSARARARLQRLQRVPAPSSRRPLSSTGAGTTDEATWERDRGQGRVCRGRPLDCSNWAVLSPRPLIAKLIAAALLTSLVLSRPRRFGRLRGRGMLRGRDAVVRGHGDNMVSRFGCEVRLFPGALPSHAQSDFLMRKVHQGGRTTGSSLVRASGASLCRAK